MKKLKRKIKQKLFNFRFNLSSKNHWLFKAYYNYLYKPKKDSLAAFLDYYSKSKNGNICVVQIGANDGISHDPIHKFIKRDRWKGVLLEPQPYVFKKYLAPLYAKDKFITTINAALGSKDESEILYKIGFSNMRWATGLATFYKQELEKNFENGSILNLCRKYGITIPTNPEEWIKTEEVKIISTESLLQSNQINHIDLLQIDTEGYDYEIIKLFNIPKHAPEVIIYEWVHLSQADQIECENYLNDIGYKTHKIGADVVCKYLNLTNK